MRPPRPRAAAAALVLTVALGAVATACHSGSGPASPTTTRPRTTTTRESALRVTTARLTADEVDVRYPRMTGGGAAVAARINATIRSDVEAAVRAFTTQADDLRPSRGPDDPPFGLDGDFDVVSAGPRWVSLRLVLSQFLGGAHPSNSVRTWNFDATDGHRLALGDAFRAGTPWVDRVSALSRAALAAALGADADPAWIERGTTADPANFAAWTITGDGIDVTFQEYQVAPYALGAPKIHLAASDLRDLAAPGGPLAG